MSKAKANEKITDDPIAADRDDPLLTVSEVAEAVRKHPDTIRRWVTDGLLRAIRLPSGLFGIRKSELDKFIGASALAEVRS